MTPQALVITYEGRIPRAYKFVKTWHKQVEIAKAYLDKTDKKMKFVNKKIRGAS